jgi:hypothetical protein
VTHKCTEQRYKIHTHTHKSSSKVRVTPLSGGTIRSLSSAPAIPPRSRKSDRLEPHTHKHIIHTRHKTRTYSCYSLSSSFYMVNKHYCVTGVHNQKCTSSLPGPFGVLKGCADYLCKLRVCNVNRCNRREQPPHLHRRRWYE